MNKTIAASIFFALGLAIAPSAHATPLAFSYLTGNLGSGFIGNSVVEINGTETVTASAWGLTGNNSTTFAQAALGQYSGYGLGVCDSTEIGNCGAPQHEVDDNGKLDFVLFSFSKSVTSVIITIDPVCNCDTNATYWAGNNISPSGLTLAALGTATASNEATKDTTRTITITNLAGMNSVLLGASITGTNNYFKIESLSATESTAPEPATFALAGAALVGIGLYRRRKLSNN